MHAEDNDFPPTPLETEGISGRTAGPPGSDDRLVNAGHGLLQPPKRARKANGSHDALEDASQ
eukprot:8651392-Karenia_brevis.AAC.1